jgi:hypothetical protein
MASKVASSIAAFATWWFAAGERDPRTPEQLEREKWVFWAPWTGKFNRWMTVIPCFAGEAAMCGLPGAHCELMPCPRRIDTRSANVHWQPVQVSGGGGGGKWGGR